MFKKIVGIIAVLFLMTGVAQAQSTSTCTDPAAYNNGKSTPCLYLPQVRPLLTAGDCLGEWTANVYNGQIIGKIGSSMPMQNSVLKVKMTSGQGNSDGTVFCYGEVVGDDGSNVNLFFNPKTGIVEVYTYIYQPVILGMNNMYLIVVHFKLFTNAQFGQYFFGRMDAEFVDQSTGMSVPTIMSHGNADISKGDGAKG